MSSLKVQDSINFGNMGDCVLKQYEVHLNEFRLTVVVLELLHQVRSELVKVSDFLIHFHVLVQEVNEDSVILICLAMLLVIHLELDFQLLVEVSLEDFSVLERVESVVEDSQDLVRPQLDNVLLAFIEVLVSHVYSLEHLRNVSHVEDVVTLCWGRQEVLLNGIEQIDGCNSKWFTQVLDLLVKYLEFELSDCLEDPLHLHFSRDSVVHNMEL